MVVCSYARAATILSIIIRQTERLLRFRGTGKFAKGLRRRYAKTFRLRRYNKVEAFDKTPLFVSGRFGFISTSLNDRVSITFDNPIFVLYYISPHTERGAIYDEYEQRRTHIFRGD